jgi:phospholipid/cholesterol/gamma-HCH transport system substrate-binding protein
MKMTPEFKVGLLTVAALFTLMFSILFVSNFHFSPGGYQVSATFNFLGDLKVNAPVEYAGGIRVGQVKDIRYANNKAVVDILITEKDFKLHQDSLVALYSTGLLGSRYVQIGADLGSGPELKTGDMIVGKDANNLDQTFSQLGDVMESFEKMMGDPAAKESFLHSFDNLNKMTDQMLIMTVQSRVKVEKMIDDLSKSSGDVTQIVANARKVSNSLAALTGALNQQQITQSVKDLNHTLSVMNGVANDIQNGKGALGVLLKDQQMGDDIKDLVEELKAHPWRLLWKK